MVMVTKTLLAASLLWLGFSTTAQADIYVYQDANGIMHMTNKQPKPGVKVRRIIRETSATPNNWRVPRTNQVRHQVYSLVDEASEQFNVDKALVRAIIQAESDYNVNALSPKGASGLMQLMPSTAAQYGVQDIFDPKQNIWAGVQYMRYLLDKFGQDVSLAVAAYNAGENAVIRYGRIPPYAETQNYVRKVLKFHQGYSQI
ncbi:MAG: lytic transglycosylase domain-containing protein [Gammaproteobacteria bacterium]|nr:lytic transglycosylase domain-containing protein [Gammaproteobacteria bacterium]